MCVCVHYEHKHTHTQQPLVINLGPLQDGCFCWLHAGYIWLAAFQAGNQPEVSYRRRRRVLARLVASFGSLDCATRAPSCTGSVVAFLRPENPVFCRVCEGPFMNVSLVRPYIMASHPRAPLSH